MNLYTNALLRCGSLVMALVALAALAAFAFAAGAFPASPSAAKQPAATYIPVSDGDVFSDPVKYRVDPSGQPVPRASSPARLEAAATPPPGSGATATPVAKPSGTKSPSGSGSPSPTVSPGGGNNDGDSDPDILLLALLTVGAAGGAGVVGLFGYLVRRRVGFWLHRPPPGGPDGGADHH